MIDSLIGYLLDAFDHTLRQLLLLLGPGLILAFMMQYVSMFLERKLRLLLGSKLYLVMFGALSTTIHETGHAIFCLLFFHRITEMKLFTLDPDERTMGYVRHSYNPDNKFQVFGNLFIGIGPILFSAFLIYLLSQWYVGYDLRNIIDLNFNGSVSMGFFRFLAETFTRIVTGMAAFVPWFFSHIQLGDLSTWIFLYLAFVIGSAVNLSPADIRGARSGFFVLIIVLFLANIIASTLFQVHLTASAAKLSTLYSFFYSIMALALFLNCVLLVATCGLQILFRVFRRP